MEEGLHKDVSEIILQAILIITVWKKVLAGFTASFLVITNATVVNLSNNLAVSNVWIVFAFKRRFSRCCKKNRKEIVIVDFIYITKFLQDFFGRRFRHNVMAASPGEGGEGGGKVTGK